MSVPRLLVHALGSLGRWGSWRTLASLAWVVAVVVVTIGCGGRPQADTASLAGRVTIDGVPVQKGGIQFMPVEKGQPAFSEVRDGAYSARVPKGRVRAIVSSVKETGRTIEVYSRSMPEIVDDLPPSLREGVEITVTGDDPQRNFELSSKTSTTK